jgi:hypothetical protein
LFAFSLVQQPRRHPEHAGRDRTALLLVGPEQCLSRTIEHGRQLPTKVVAVLHTGVQALAAGWRMGVRGITGKEHTADPIAFCKTCVHLVRGRPAHRVDDDVPAGPFGDQRRQSRGREIDIAPQRHRTLHLKK